MESLKNSGNSHFAAGNYNEAVESYRAALAEADRCLALSRKDGGEIAPVNALRAAVFANMSLVYLHQQKCRESWEAAAAAVAIQPTHLKAWLRYVESKRLDGFPFEAFVALLRHVRPLVRAEVVSKKMGASEAVGVLSTCETPLFRDLGLSSVSENIELVDYRNGVALVARAAMKPNETLFVEKFYDVPFKNEENMQDATTVNMVLRFAQKLRPHQEGGTKEWTQLKKQMKGAWPRSMEEVSGDVMSAITPTLKEEFGDLSDAEFDELLEMSLVCRFNSFQSGFFRVCALANHSCAANIAMKHRPSNNTTTMVTVMDISPGDLLNVKYLGDAHLLMGVGKRREYLRSWLFWCDCERCQRDTQSNAEVESIACPSCGKYVFHPFTPNAVTRDEEMLQFCEAPCVHCKAPLSQWIDVHGAVVNAFLTKITQSNALSIEQLPGWMRNMLEELKLLQIHPAHWMYRLILFFVCAPFCHHLQTIVSEVDSGAHQHALTSLFRPSGLRELYVPLIEQHLEDSREASSASIFSSPGLLATLREGCDMLNTFVLLWLHISSFYPPFELWAIHRATCQIVLLHLLFQKSGSDVCISQQHAFQLLSRHAAYLSVEDTALLTNFFNVQKAKASNPRDLPTVAKLKKIFR